MKPMILAFIGIGLLCSIGGYQAGFHHGYLDGESAAEQRFETVRQKLHELKMCDWVDAYAEAYRCMPGPYLSRVAKESKHGE
jgi:hypothetical protein